MSGKTSIEHVLRAHYRAITDINWHNTEPDTVVSTGIDSWLWAWDLRAAQKPVMGECIPRSNINSIDSIGKAYAPLAVSKLREWTKINDSSNICSWWYAGQMESSRRKSIGFLPSE